MDYGADDWDVTYSLGPAAASSPEDPAEGPSPRAPYDDYNHNHNHINHDHGQPACVSNAGRPRMASSRAACTIEYDDIECTPDYRSQERHSRHGRGAEGGQRTRGTSGRADGQ
eukprot:3818338-Pyramimonas_sp.AAC.1